MAALVPAAFLPDMMDAFALPKQLLLLVTLPLLVFAVRGESVPRLPRGLLLACGAVVAVELLSFAGAPDRLGAILGVSGYRFGLATQLALLGLLICAAVTIRTHAQVRQLLLMVSAGATVVVAYALVQAVSLDPFDWSVPSSERVFASIGNPNDLAGYCVLCVSFVGLPLASHGRRSYVLAGVVVAILATTVLLTESRSGLIALAVAVLALPLYTALNRWPKLQRTRLAGSIVGACALLLLIGLATGRAETAARRFTGVLSTGDVQTDSIRTRWDIWRGTASVVQHYPAFGVGQDGLVAQFNRYRPADLGAPFSEVSPTGEDPLVASPHNAAIEVLVTLGAAGFAAVLCLLLILSRSAWRCLHGPPSNDIPFILAGMSGFVVSALLNPLNLASCVLASVLAGCLVGLDPRRPMVVEVNIGLVRHRAVGSMAVLATTCSVILGVVHVWADHEAYSAIQAASAQDWTRSEVLAERAARVMPFERAYRRAEVVATLTAANSVPSTSTQGHVLLVQSENVQMDFLHSFPGLASDFIRLAGMRAELGQPGVAQAIEAAHEESPHGINTAQEIAKLTQQGKG